MKRGLLIIALLSIITLAGCTLEKENEKGDKVSVQTNIEDNIKQYTFDMGYLIEIKINGYVQYILYISELNNSSKYTIQLEGKQGAMFGSGNVELKIGELEQETEFIPVNSQLFLWSVHSEHLVKEKENLEIVIRENKEMLVSISLQ